MVLYWIVVFTGLRAAVMDYLLMPMAKKGGIATAKNQTRFAEQAWLLIYVSVFWSLGIVSALQPIQSLFLTQAVYSRELRLLVRL
jgi:hypothetical protein